jgi:hypothetical protein
MHGPFDVTGGLVGVVGGALDEPVAALPLPCPVVKKEMPPMSTQSFCSISTRPTRSSGCWAP